MNSFNKFVPFKYLKGTNLLNEFNINSHSLSYINSSNIDSNLILFDFNLLYAVLDFVDLFLNNFVVLDLNKFSDNFINYKYNYFLNINNFCIFKPHAIKLISLPDKRRKFTLLRSPHIDKKSREQYELVTNKVFFNYNISGYMLNINNFFDILGSLKSANLEIIQTKCNFSY